MEGCKSQKMNHMVCRWPLLDIFQETIFNRNYNPYVLCSLVHILIHEKFRCKSVNSFTKFESVEKVLAALLVAFIWQSAIGTNCMILGLKKTT